MKLPETVCKLEVEVSVAASSSYSYYKFHLVNWLNANKISLNVKKPKW